MGASNRRLPLLRCITKISARTIKPCARKKVTTKRMERVMLPAEKREILQTWRKHKLDLSKAIMACHEMMWTHAEEMANDFGKHDAAWYFSNICQQQPTMQLNNRKSNLWNVFLYGQTKRHNALLQREKEERMREDLEEFEELRDERKHAPHNTNMANLAVIHHEVQSARIDVSLKTDTLQLNMLRDCTRLQTVAFSVSDEYDVWSEPQVYCSCEALSDFWLAVLRETLEKFALRLHSFLVAGINGMVSNYQQQTLEAKAKLAALIKEKLNEVLPVQVPQMRYKNFATNITLKYRMDICGYPPSIKFSLPRQLSSLLEVDIVQASWESGTTYWHCLDYKEYDKWPKEYGRWKKRYNEAVASGRVNEDSDDNFRVTVLPGASVSTSIFVLSGNDAPAPGNDAPTPSGAAPTPSGAALGPGDAALGLGNATHTHAPGNATLTPSNAALGTAASAPATTPGDPSEPGPAHTSIPESCPDVRTAAGTRRPSTSERGGKCSKVAKDPFINLGCVTDANGQPKQIECSTCKPRKKETKARKRKGTAQASDIAMASGSGSSVGDNAGTPLMSVWNLKMGKMR